MNKMERKRGQAYNKKYADEFDFIASSGKSNIVQLARYVGEICQFCMSVVMTLLFIAISKQHITAFQSKSSA